MLSNFVKLDIDTDEFEVEACLEMQVDLTVKGNNSIPFLNNAKFRTTQGVHSGDADGLGDIQGKMDFKAKGRVRNDDFDDAIDLTDD